jgi:hypothetical protein
VFSLSKQTLIGIDADTFYYQLATGAGLGGFEGTDIGLVAQEPS